MIKKSSTLYLWFHLHGWVESSFITTVFGMRPGCSGERDVREEVQHFMGGFSPLSEDTTGFRRATTVAVLEDALFKQSVALYGLKYFQQRDFFWGFGKRIAFMSTLECPDESCL